jgi:dolichol-phosphate mannosyltransferase
LPFTDSTGGFRAWRGQALRDIDLPTVNADGYGFQIVMAYRTWKQKKKIVEIPIIFTERRSGKSKMSKQIIFEALWLVWKLRILG